MVSKEISPFHEELQLQALKQYAYTDSATEVSLRPFHPTETHAIHRLTTWELDPNVNALYYHPGTTILQTEKMHELGLRIQMRSLRCAYFHIFHNEEDPIGIIRLALTEGVGASTDIVVLIGEKSKWGKHIGTSAVRLGLFAAKIGGFKTVNSSVLEANLGSRGIFDKIPSVVTRNEKFPQLIEYAIDVASLQLPGADHFTMAME